MSHKQVPSYESVNSVETTALAVRSQKVKGYKPN